MASLVQALCGEDLPARQAASEALVQHPDQAEVERALLEVLADANRFAPAAAAWLEPAIGGGAGGLFSARRGPDELLSLRVGTLDVSAWGSEVERPIRDALDLEVPWSPRLLAAHTLGSRSSLSDAAIAALLEHTRDADPAVGAQAKHVLCDLGARCAPIVLAKFAHQPDQHQLWLLRQWPSAVEAALPELLRSDVAEVRRRALQLACGVAARTPSLQPILGQRLVAAVGDEARRIAVALARCGVAAAPVLLAALRAGGDSQRYAAGALGLMASDSKVPLALPDDVIAELVGAASSEDVTTAHWALSALAPVHLAAEARAELGAELLVRAKSRDGGSREVASRHLVTFVPEPTELAAALQKLRRSSDAATATWAWAATVRSSQDVDASVARGVVAMLRSERAHTVWSALVARCRVDAEAYAAWLEVLNGLSGASAQALGVALCEAARARADVDTLRLLRERAETSVPALRALLASSAADTLAEDFAACWREGKPRREELLDTAQGMSDAVLAPFLRGALDDQDASVRRAALSCLEARPALAVGVERALLEALGREETARAATAALAAAPLDIVRKHEAELRAWLRRTEPPVRQGAATLLRRLQ